MPLLKVKLALPKPILVKDKQMKRIFENLTKALALTSEQKDIIVCEIMTIAFNTKSENRSDYQHEAISKFDAKFETVFNGMFENLSYSELVALDAALQ